MFQNISDDSQVEDMEEKNEVNKGKWKLIAKNIFKFQNIILYIFSAMVSSVSIISGLAPFGIAIFAAACGNGIIAFPIFIATIIGTFLGFGIQPTLIYILTALIFMVLMFLKRPAEDYENKNEKKKLGIHLMVSIFLVQIMQIFSGSFLIADFIEILMQCMISYIFYKIFVNSLQVISNFGKNKIFSAEEAIGACLFIAISLCCLGDIKVFEFSIRNILCALLVLALGWRNGILIGTTTGVTLGVVLTIIGLGQPIIIAIYAICGMIAGVLNKIGRLGILLGIVVGIGVCAYLSSNGFTLTYLYVREIIISAIALLFMPKSINLNIEDIIGKTKMLPVTGDNKLEENKETIYKLNTMSETINEIAKSYDEAAATMLEDKDLIEQNKKSFKDDLSVNIESISDNILYDDISEYKNGMVDDIFEILLDKGEITKQDLIDVFEKHNSYIEVGIEDEEILKNMEKDIFQMVKTINYTYGLSKINFIWKKKVSEGNKVVSNQLGKVSKAIDTLAEEIKNDEKPTVENETKQIKIILEQKNINYIGIEVKKQKNGRYIIGIILEEPANKFKVEEILSKLLKSNIKYIKTKEDIQIFETKDKFKINMGISHTTKTKSKISGDTSTQIKLKDGKYLLAISDGMGSGQKAKNYSNMAIKMLENLFSSGFDRELSLELINSALTKVDEENTFATLDISILDLYKGTIEFIKSGACPTYIKTKNEIFEIEDESTPAGLISDLKVVTYDKDLEEGDIIVMCSDGVMDSNPDDKNWLKKYIEQMKIEDVQKTADIIIREAIDNGLGNARDDMTVIIAKIQKN